MFASTAQSLLRSSRVACAFRRNISNKQIQKYAEKYLKGQKRELAKLDAVILSRVDGGFEENLCCNKKCEPMSIITAHKANYQCQDLAKCRQYE